ncbi:beta-galactosidase 15 [Pyrus ussuriensis x Pyrus communis]|uniref:Beta-galactosidase 15 n=1 Tax=Pyrus ussuriensis x Pyrus communis TaxID=2448454 RepID=A0A5N5I454_9ROSA|nr:beta-galactosidase 15 [Pyrus ussuriensis x Pyrus communis]
MNPNHLLGRGGPRPLMTPDSLQWEKVLRADQLMDQREAGNDSSESLWYMTSVHLKKYEPIWSKNMALRVNGAGLILHAYVKGDHKNVKLHPGKNIISLWSATVGFPATFKAPLGTDPVAVDIQGEGQAWISGHSIGRYWPSYLSYYTDCSLDASAYRGSYDNKKYSFNCGNPTQRRYHVPRSFMQDGENTIVLFEEFGGNPSLVNFLTIQVGAVCAHAYEKHTVELACEGRPFLNVWARRSAHVSDSKFGSTNCGDAVKKLAAEAIC